MNRVFQECFMCFPKELFCLLVSKRMIQTGLSWFHLYVMLQHSILLSLYIFLEYILMKECIIKLFRIIMFFSGNSRNHGGTFDQKRVKWVFLFVCFLFVCIYSFSNFFEHPLYMWHSWGHLGHWLIKQSILPLKSLPKVGGT